MYLDRLFNLETRGLGSNPPTKIIYFRSLRRELAVFKRKIQSTVVKYVPLKTAPQHRCIELFPKPCTKVGFVLHLPEQ